jgi:hypothetical protein
MLTIPDQIIIASLRGYTPPSLRNAKIKEPTPADVENLLQRMTPQDIKKYGGGKYGANFVAATNKALAEFAAENLNPKKK